MQDSKLEGEGLQGRGKYGIIKYEENHDHTAHGRATESIEEGHHNGRTLGIGRAFVFFRKIGAITTKRGEYVMWDL